MTSLNLGCTPLPLPPSPQFPTHTCPHTPTQLVISNYSHFFNHNFSKLWEKQTLSAFVTCRVSSGSKACSGLILHSVNIVIAIDKYHQPNLKPGLHTPQDREQLQGLVQLLFCQEMPYSVRMGGASSKQWLDWDLPLGPFSHSFSRWLAVLGLVSWPKTGSMVYIWFWLHPAPPFKMALVI